MSVSAIRKAAYVVYRKALYHGDIVRATSCESCGKIPGEGQRVLHGHHTDYNKPIDVQWLCSTCHRKAHRRDSEGLQSVSLLMPLTMLARIDGYREAVYSKTGAMPTRTAVIALALDLFLPKEKANE